MPGSLPDRAADLAVAVPLQEATSPTWGRPAQVSVVVSSHDRDSLLAGLLTRLDQQDHPSFEAVVVDNGSPDRTWSVLTEWVARTPVPALVLRVPGHDGPAVPRNTAVRRSRAALLAFTDDDCLPSPHWLSALVDGLADPTVAVVQGRTDPEAGGWAGPWGRSLHVDGVSGLFETANLGCRRADFLQVGGFGAQRLLTGRAFGEDVVLGAALVRYGSVVYRPDAHVEHRVLPGSYRDFLTERQRLGGFPHLVAAVPSLREQLVAGLFLSRRTLAADLGVAGLLGAAVGRRTWPALAALPWLLDCWREAERRPGRARAVRAAQLALAVVVGLGGLVIGSARARKVVL
ncbi:MAG: glycosyltransferase family 2 protein [Mycobacteriales bacterium]